MKKLITIILILTMLLPVVALADLPDISGLSLEELHQLRENICKEILSKSQWTEVEVPVGFYVVGEDIPAGHWTIRPIDMAMIEYFSKVDDTGKNADYSGSYFSETLGVPGNRLEQLYKTQEIDIELKEGYFVHIDIGNVVFEPFTGRKSPFFN
jgi:hypothetical protein